MAELHGSAGAIYMNSDTGATFSDVASDNTFGALIQTGGFTSWSLDINLDTLETTNFATGLWKTYTTGLKGWTGTADQHWQSDLLDELGEKVLVRFYLDETNSDYYYGLAHVGGLSVETPVDTLVDQSLTFTGDSSLYFTG